MIEVAALPKGPFCSKQTIAEKLLVSKKVSSERVSRVGWNVFSRENSRTAADCVLVFLLLSFQN